MNVSKLQATQMKIVILYKCNNTTYLFENTFFHKKRKGYFCINQIYTNLIMIQRIQTIYLFIVALLMAALFLWFPQITTISGEIVLDKVDLWVIIPIFASVLLAILSIFKYKNRQTQFVLNRLNSLFIFILLGVFVYRPLMVSGETQVSEKGIGLFFPIISIVFLVLANKAIKKDERLVKSVDRLR